MKQGSPKELKNIFVGIFKIELMKYYFSVFDAPQLEIK